MFACLLICHGLLPVARRCRRQSSAPVRMSCRASRWSGWLCNLHFSVSAQHASVSTSTSIHPDRATRASSMELGGNAENDPTTSQEPEQTLLLLTPFTTTAPISGGNLADYLQESSPYRVRRSVGCAADDPSCLNFICAAFCRSSTARQQSRRIRNMGWSRSSYQSTSGRP